MLRKAMHVLLGTTFVVILGMQAAWAVSFGKVDVASKMGEPFYAEVPLRLNDNETLRKTSVELGTTADYRILEVFRNPILNGIRADVVDDERGTRVVLTSDVAIDEAFFNIILKVRYGRSTHYKKVSVFLDIPKVTSSPSTNEKVKPLPAVYAASVDPTSSAAFATKDPEGKKVETKEAFDEPAMEESQAAGSFAPFEGWARTAKYGPMVYGDTITTVAKRLRIDDRFTNKQVMVALFEKNKAQFSKDNINLIKAGAYLDVPTATEVRQVSPNAAKAFLSEQESAWKAMRKQGQYAALAEAQRTRYSSRIRIGQGATGTARQPVATANIEALKTTVLDPSKKDNYIQTKENMATSGKAVKFLEKKLIQKDAAFTALQEKMTALEDRLMAFEKNGQSVGSSAPVSDATAAVFEAQNKRLELVITRLKTQLEQAKTNVSAGSNLADWILYVLIGLGLIILSLLIAVFMLFKRGRKHPADSEGIDLDNFHKDTKNTHVADSQNEDLEATKFVDADDFEMPDASASLDDVDVSDELFGSDGDLKEIPDLTDEETGEMEPFNEDEEPSLNVNYLEDADVYLRYGMEDEAEQQVLMALKLQEDNPEAHAKMVQIQKAKGNDASANDAIVAAKVVLTGAALAIFETAISGEDSVAEEVGDAVLEDLPRVNKDDQDRQNDSIDISSIDFDESAEVALEENSSDSTGDDGLDIDFDFSDMVKSDDEDTAVESGGDAMPDLDIDFDISDIVENGETGKDEQLVAPDENSGGPLISGELEEVDISGMGDITDSPSLLNGIGSELKSLDSDGVLEGLDSLDFGEIVMRETLEVVGDAEPQLVSSDGSDLEESGVLNDFEIDKARAEREAEDQATFVELEKDSEDPFMDAKQALDEKDGKRAAEDWTFESVGTLTGEEEDPLSLADEKHEETKEDGTLDVSLDDLDMDFELPDLDADEALLTDAPDSTFVMDAGDAASEDASAIDVTADAVDLDFIDLNASDDEEVSLDDLDIGFELPDLDADDAVITDASDSTFVMGADDAAIGLDVTTDDVEETDLLMFDSESTDNIDSDMDDLDVSLITIDPVHRGFDDEDTNLNISMDVSDKDILADLDADLSELEFHEESIISNVENLGFEDEGVVLDESKDLDETFILNDVAKNKTMLEEGGEESSSYFENLDDAMQTSVTDDPMVDSGSPHQLDTIRSAEQLDELLKDLDDLLDEGKDKK